MSQGTYAVKFILSAPIPEVLEIEHSVYYGGCVAWFDMANVYREIPYFEDGVWKSRAVIGRPGRRGAGEVGAENALGGGDIIGVESNRSVIEVELVRVLNRVERKVPGDERIVGAGDVARAARVKNIAGGNMAEAGI